MVTRDLLRTIFELDASDRQYLRDALDASLVDGLPPQLTPAEQQELLQRIDDSIAHPEKLLTWAEVKQQLATQRAEKRR